MPSTIGIVASGRFGPSQSWYVSPKQYNLTGASLSTPHSSNVNITGDLEIIMHLEWTSASFLFLASKWSATAAQNAWAFWNPNGSNIGFTWKDSGGTQRDVLFPHTGVPIGPQWMRLTLDVDNGAGGHAVSLYRAANSATVPTSWTQISTTKNAGAFTTSIRSTSLSPLSFLGETGTIVGGMSRGMYLYNGLVANGGTLAAQFNPADATTPAATSIVSSSTGETWTLANRNGTGFLCSSSSAIVMCEGDSLTAGVGTASATNSYPSQMASLLASTVTVANTAQAGDFISSVSTDFTDCWSPLYDAGLKNIAVIWVGTNNLAGSTTTGSAAWSALASVLTTIRNAGWKVVVCDMIPRTDAGIQADFDTKRQDFNTLMAANWSTYADAFVQLSANANLSDSTNTTYFQADKVHLTTAGNTVVAGLVQPAVSALL